MLEERFLEALIIFFSFLRIFSNILNFVTLLRIFLDSLFYFKFSLFDPRQANVCRPRLQHLGPAQAR